MGMGMGSLDLPQSSRWTHWTAFTRPECPFSKSTTTLSYTSLQLEQPSWSAKKWSAFINSWTTQPQLAWTTSEFQKPTQKTTEHFSFFYYLRIVKNHRVTWPERNGASATPGDNVGCPVGATGDMARLHHGRCHLGNRRRCCGVATNRARVKSASAEINVPVTIFAHKKKSFYSTNGIELILKFKYFWSSNRLEHFKHILKYLKYRIEQ